MSTIGGVPTPVSGTRTSSINRGFPSRSVVVPTGTSELFPASINRDPGARWKSLAIGLTYPGGGELNVHAMLLLKNESSLIEFLPNAARAPEYVPYEPLMPSFVVPGAPTRFEATVQFMSVPLPPAH